MTEDINRRWAQRNVPSADVRPMFTPHPIPTRYTVHAGAPTSSTPHASPAYPNYTVESVFHPGNRAAPLEGFRVDHESDMRGQTGYALSTHPKTVYIPHESSSLYHVVQGVVPRGTLKSSTPKFIHPDVGTLLFGNNTRDQLRGIQ